MQNAGGGGGGDDDEGGGGRVDEVGFLMTMLMIPYEDDVGNGDEKTVAAAAKRK